MSQSVLPELEHPYIDMETGEILEDQVQNIGEADLSKLARAIRAIDYKVAMIDDFVEQEVSRIKDVAGAKRQKLTDSRAQLLKFAENELITLGHKKEDLPGIGTFRFRRLPERVDTIEFDEMAERDQESIIVTSPGLFKNVPETWRPNKAEIKKFLKRLDGNSAKGFRLVRDPDKFEFKGE